MIRNVLCLTLDSILGRQHHARYRELLSLQRFNKTEMARIQQQKLCAFLLHTYQHVDYYRAILSQAEVVDDNGQVHLDRFQNIPFLTKGTLRSRFEDLKSDDLSQRRWQENTSGGSTAEPVRFIQDMNYHDNMLAVKALFDSWSGCPPGHKKALLWGAERDLYVGKITWHVRGSRWLRNQVWLNAFRMGMGNMEQYVAILNQFKPDQILAYAESLHELAQFIKSKNLPVCSPKAVMTSAGMLYPHMRKLFAETFHAPVFNRYGTREVGDIACECDRHEGLHWIPSIHYVEVLRPDGSLADPGEEGEIAITLLTNYAMPMIRYKIGDRGAMSDKLCSCGRALPLLEEIVGRVTDPFIRKEGGVVSSVYFSCLIGSILNKGMIKKFQVIQEDYEVIRINLVPSYGIKSQEGLLNIPELKDMEKKIKVIMGKDCVVRVDLVEDILPTSSGKYRNIFSLINQTIKGSYLAFTILMIKISSRKTLTTIKA